MDTSEKNRMGHINRMKDNRPMKIVRDQSPWQEKHR